MKKLSYILLGVTLFVVSCKGTQSDIIPIPKTASGVMNINAKSLSSKMNAEEFFQYDVFKDLLKEVEDTNLIYLFRNPSATGIDTDKNITFFTTNTGKEINYSLGGFIANEEALEKYIATYIGTAVEGKGYKYAIKENIYFGWDNEKFIVSAGMKDPYTNLNFQDYENYENNNNLLSIDPAVITAELEKYFNLSGSDLLNGTKHFKEAMALDGDMQSYSDFSSTFASYLKLLGPTKIADLIKNTYVIGSSSFENGKIVSKSKVIMNDILKKLTKKHFKNHVYIQPLQHFAGKEVVAGMAMQISPAFIVDLIKETGFDGIINSQLTREGLSLDDISNAFGNTMIVGLTGFDQSEPNDNPGNYEPTGAFGLEIKNLAEFKKIMNVFHSQGNNVFDSSIAYNDKLLVIASSKTLANSILESNAVELNAYAKNLKNTTGGMFMDVEKLIPLVMPMFKNDNEKESANLFNKYFKGGYIKSEIEGDEVVSHLLIDMKNTNENSLKSIAAFTDELYKLNQKNRNSLDDLEELYVPIPDDVKQ